MSPGRRWPSFTLLEKVFLALALLAVALWFAGAGGFFAGLVTFAAVSLGAWLGIRLLVRGIRRAIWRLRNRLIVTYVFIAVVPIILILFLAQLGASVLAQQVGVYLVNSELDRRLAFIRSGASGFLRVPPQARPLFIQRNGTFVRERFPGFQMLARDSKEEYRFPADSDLAFPPSGWNPAYGLVARDGLLYAWALERKDDLQVLAMAPITRQFLADLVPNLGLIDLVWFPDPDRSNRGTRARPHDDRPADSPGIPPGANFFDRAILWGTAIPVSLWAEPQKQDSYLLSVHTRVSAILNVVFSGGWERPGLLQILYGLAMLLLVVQIVSLVIGVSLTRTITGTVHAIYEGTERVKEGDFGHRIAIKGNDQLAELAMSFNSMTENLQRLVTVEKERERLQAELEIAREVQDALQPRVAPRVKRLRVTTACNAARMVSGDYYDYQMLGETRLALAVGDVAGKGISAALLMATVQSAFRTQIRHCVEAAAKATNGGASSVITAVATSQLVTQLNQQLYDYTAAEKYATFFLAFYDDESGEMTYTNAGHLPPLLIRDGEAHKLEINGMVVGAFPFARYGESQVRLESGDLLVCYTDGVTEPENEYGEMFGEERLIDVLIRNARRDENEIAAAVTGAVRQWTGSPELQDDMTLVLARRV
ncbi:MAG: SpoIIE family protein phosphatase [Bryobacteraceae bacterium]|nr:SpoIIE family protein phosphatase [Bryobacteraceae bacterium]